MMIAGLDLVKEFIKDEVKKYFKEDPKNDSISFYVEKVRKRDDIFLIVGLGKNAYFIKGDGINSVNIEFERHFLEDGFGNFYFNEDYVDKQLKKLDILFEKKHISHNYK